MVGGVEKLCELSSHWQGSLPHDLRNGSLNFGLIHFYYSVGAGVAVHVYVHESHLDFLEALHILKIIKAGLSLIPNRNDRF